MENGHYSIAKISVKNSDSIEIKHCDIFYSILMKLKIAQSAGAVEYTDCISAIPLYYHSSQVNSVSEL